MRFLSATFPALPTTSLLASTALKRLVVIIIVLSTLYYFQRESIHVLWNERFDAHGSAEHRVGQHQDGQHQDAPQEVAPDFRASPEEWGLWGREVARLSERGRQLLDLPQPYRTKFIDLVENRFRFMKDATNNLYNPWTAPLAPDSPDTGLVICVGSINYWMAAHLLANLRKVVGSELPIEIAFAGEDDLRIEHRQFLASISGDLAFVDLLDKFPHAHDDLENAGWAMKPFALLASSFPRAILVDADAIFFSPPDHLFESHPGLKETGALYYHDRAAFLVHSGKQDFLEAQFAAANLTPSDMLTKHSMFWNKTSFYEADSGLVALDKTRPGVFLALIFTAWLNSKALRQKPSYPLFYGDKETYWIANELASVPYAMPDWYAGSMGTANGTDRPDFRDGDEAQVCGKHMLHLDHTGERPFWINNGILHDKASPDQGYARITHYWRHTEDFMKKPPSWWWHEGNTACLKERGVRKIDEATRLVLDRTIDEAEKIEDLIRAASS